MQFDMKMIQSQDKPQEQNQPRRSMFDRTPSPKSNDVSIEIVKSPTETKTKEFMNIPIEDLNES